MSVNDITRKFRQIAKALSDGDAPWVVETRHDYQAHLKRKAGGITISLRIDGFGTENLDNRRIAIAGVYVSNLIGTYLWALREENRPAEISVAFKRAAVDIAQDIRRRLLPDVIKHTPLALQQAQKLVEQAKIVEETAKRLATAGDGQVFRSHSSDFSQAKCRSRYDSSKVWWEAEVSTYPEAPTIKLEINNLKPQQAEALLRMAQANFGMAEISLLD